MGNRSLEGGKVLDGSQRHQYALDFIYVILCRGTYIEDFQIVTTEGAKKQCPLAAGPTPGAHSCFSALLPVRRAP